MATILFVDDDEVERIFAREVLEPRGHRVIFAGDGEGALEIFQQPDAGVDVVVTDLAMPKLNGLRLIKALKKINGKVRIIAASGVSADQLDLAEQFGAVRTLHKPWAPQDFFAALDDVLDVPEASRHRNVQAADEVWNFEDHRQLSEPAEMAPAWPPLLDLMGLWVGDEHFFPSPSVSKGLIAQGRIEIRPVLGNEGLLLERDCTLDSEVRERRLGLLSWADAGRRVVRHDFEGGGGKSPRIFEGRWTGAVLELEGRGPGGVTKEEHWWRNETLTIRSWIIPDVAGAEAILAFEGTYQRIRTFAGS